MARLTPKQIQSRLSALQDWTKSGGVIQRTFAFEGFVQAMAFVGKVAEEAEEFIRAAGGEADGRVVSEAADLLYHMLVLLACRGLSLQPVVAELARRFGTSGLVEKASRAAAARVEGGDA